MYMNSCLQTIEFMYIIKCANDIAYASTCFIPAGVINVLAYYCGILKARSNIGGFYEK